MAGSLVTHRQTSNHRRTPKTRITASFLPALLITLALLMSSCGQKPQDASQNSAAQNSTQQEAAPSAGETADPAAGQNQAEDTAYPLLSSFTEKYGDPAKLEEPLTFIMKHRRQCHSS